MRETNLSRTRAQKIRDAAADRIVDHFRRTGRVSRDAGPSEAVGQVLADTLLDSYEEGTKLRDKVLARRFVIQGIVPDLIQDKPGAGAAGPGATVINVQGDVIHQVAQLTGQTPGQVVDVSPDLPGDLAPGRGGNGSGGSQEERAPSE